MNDQLHYYISATSVQYNTTVLLFHKDINIIKANIFIGYILKYLKQIFLFSREEIQISIHNLLFSKTFLAKI